MAGPATPAGGPPAFDVIVVGGGLSGGLPAAAYLQKAGLQVLIVEANAELGSFCCTHETWPQTLDSPHVGISFAGNSPVVADLELPRYGFRFAPVGGGEEDRRRGEPEPVAFQLQIVDHG